jgi:hypothetical protein
MIKCILKNKIRPICISCDLAETPYYKEENGKNPEWVIRSRCPNCGHRSQYVIPFKYENLCDIP